MVKNVKIDDETHRRLSIEAAQLGCKKSDLCSVLVRAAIDGHTKEQMRNLVLNYTPEDNETND